MSKFEVVSKYIGEDGNTTITLPVRATEHSAGYDFAVARDIIIPSMRGIMAAFEDGYIAKKIPYSYEDIKSLTKTTGFKPTLIPTGIKCQLDPGKYLEISVRSSTPLNSWIVLANGVGIIDGDYYNNPDNEGEIFFQVINLSPVDIVLNAGDKIGQGIIKSYDKVEGDDVTTKRTGGLGSTNA